MQLTQTPRHRLGAKTFTLFVLRRSQPVFIGLLVFVGSGIVSAYAEGKYAETIIRITNFTALGGLGITALGLLVAFGIAWLEYVTYHFELGDHALHIRRGILYKTETAIPYRQIQNVNIVRDLFYQMIGLSQIVILSAGHDGDENNEGADEPEGVLPALDNDWARELQAELLKRANTERIAMLPK